MSGRPGTSRYLSVMLRKAVITSCRAEDPFIPSFAVGTHAGFEP